MASDYHMGQCSPRHLLYLYRYFVCKWGHSIHTFLNLFTYNVLRIFPTYLILSNVSWHSLHASCSSERDGGKVTH